MKKIFLIGNHDIVIYNFRIELIKKLIQEGYLVGVILPYGEKVELLIDEGCLFYETKVDRRGTSVWRDIKLIFKYWYILKKERPDVILTYTIKPNIYANIVAGILGIPSIVNITGLGSAIENKGIIQKISLFLYKLALKRADYVFFQNNENLRLFRKMHIGNQNFGLLPGSGVNIEDNQFQEYPKDKIVFVFAGRLMYEKGIEEYLYAAEVIKKMYPAVEFHICGFCEEEYKQKLETLQHKGIVVYHGMVKDMRTVYRDMSCLILPSHHEGMSNVLLEAAANGRPGIATNISGCKEIITHGKTGFLFEKKNSDQLCKMLERFIKLPFEEKLKMGMDARKKMEEKFDRNIVIEKYLKIIKEL